jgi:hypothetical protein
VTAGARPRAGGRLSLTVRARWQDGVPVKRGQVRCSASLGGRTLTSGTARIAAGSAVCSFRVPKGTAGRTLLVRASVRDAQGTLGTRSRAFAVKRS